MFSSLRRKTSQNQDEQDYKSWNIQWFQQNCNKSVVVLKMDSDAPSTSSRTSMSIINEVATIWYWEHDTRNQFALPKEKLLIHIITEFINYY